MLGWAWACDFPLFSPPTLHVFAIAGHTRRKALANEMIVSVRVYGYVERIFPLAADRTSPLSP